MFALLSIMSSRKSYNNPIVYPDNMEYSLSEKDGKVEITIKSEDPIKESINNEDGAEYEIINFITPAKYETVIVIDLESSSIRITKTYCSPEKSIQKCTLKWNEARGNFSKRSYGDCVSGGTTSTNFWTVELRKERVLVKLNGKKAIQNIGAEKLLAFMTNINDSIEDLIVFLRNIFVRDQTNNGCDDWRTLHF